MSDGSKQKTPRCSRCGNTETKEVNFGQAVIGSLVGASCMLWIPVVGWALIPVFLLMAIGSGIAAANHKDNPKYFCPRCRKQFTVDTEGGCGER